MLQNKITGDVIDQFLAFPVQQSVGRVLMLIGRIIFYQKYGKAQILEKRSIFFWFHTLSLISYQFFFLTFTLSLFFSWSSKIPIINYAY